MANNSHIEWTDASWNCLAGCEAVSPGCANCYAATMTRRLEAMGQKDYAGLTTAKHFNGKVRCLPHKLDVPLKWRKPRRVFVNSMSDLFHEDVPDEFIDKVFAVMALCPQHTFQVLTKRPERMCQHMNGKYLTDGVESECCTFLNAGLGKEPNPKAWPLPNVWLGISAEDQQQADERIPWLLKTPAAVRFVSAEPLLGPIDFGNDLLPSLLSLRGCLKPDWTPRSDKVDWVIVGGESGSGARPCNLEWIRSIIGQCKAAGVACFVKQLGAKPFDGACDSEPFDGSCGHGMGIADGRHYLVGIDNKKGGDPDEWPEDLRVREFPAVEAKS